MLMIYRRKAAQFDLFDNGRQLFASCHLSQVLLFDDSTGRFPQSEKKPGSVDLSRIMDRQKQSGEILERVSALPMPGHRSTNGLSPKKPPQCSFYIHRLGVKDSS
jgi:hypothetical protein